MATTYVNLVNGVLRRLREPEIDTATQVIADDAYWVMLGDFVNDAKREVEDAWNWWDLMTFTNDTTVSGTGTLALTGTTHRTKILEVYDTDSAQQYRLRKTNQAVIDNFNKVGNSQNAPPIWYAEAGYNSSAEKILDFWPIPDGSYTIECRVKQPQADLSADADTFNLEGVDHVVIYKAWAMAISERGEDGGQLFDEIMAKADKMLADAILLDRASGDCTAGDFEVA